MFVYEYACACLCVCVYVFAYVYVYMHKHACVYVVMKRVWGFLGRHLDRTAGAFSSSVSGGTQSAARMALDLGFRVSGTQMKNFSGPFYQGYWLFQKCIGLRLILQRPSKGSLRVL